MVLTKISAGASEVSAGTYSADEFAIRLRRGRVLETIELDYDEAALLFDVLGQWLEGEDIEDAGN